uniref:Myb-like domain-containing protein n=1 Tax=Brassica oleracea var. oleracea TaxID=109376 RepID=A0A0D3BXU4_BRAOL
MKNHLTSLSGPELSSTYLSSLSGPELFSAKAARIKLDEAESSKKRSAFATEIQLHLLFLSSIFETLSFSSHSYLTLDMDFNPFRESANFVDLLNSQQNVVFGNVTDSVSLSSSHAPFFASQGPEYLNFTDDTQGSRKERRAWTPTDDVVLISSWLNTSKDAVVGTEQKSLAFWKRIAAYYNASPKLAGSEKREAAHCNNRWQKNNDIVCKFCGAYEAASREKTSGQNENDVLKLVHEIFFTNHKKKFTLEHAWKKLRNDQKWCELSTAKAEGSSKKRKNSGGDDEATTRPPGVKAAKARSRKPLVDGKELAEFQTMWSMKKEDLALKENLSKIKLLDTLIARQGTLADYEEETH